MQGGTSEPSAPIAVYFQGDTPLPDPGRVAVLVELGYECLGAHTGEAMGSEGSNVVGFALYRNGADAPSNLIEIVRQMSTPTAAIDAACQLFSRFGFETAVCGDQAGRIVDRLVRPMYNAALRFLDEGLATQADMDMTCRLGLGYRDGPLERVARGGLAYHYDLCKALQETSGSAQFAPARRAVVAATRARAGKRLIGKSSWRPPTSATCSRQMREVAPTATPRAAACDDCDEESLR
jgi:3-hydroxybutyryl-CoA dehydrogenase